MGWAIKRADNSYRCWNAHSKDDALLSGESWEERDTPPVIACVTPPPPLIAANAVADIPPLSLTLPVDAIAATQSVRTKINEILATERAANQRKV